MLRKMFAEVSSTTSRAKKKREELLITIRRELLSHAKAEEETLYARLSQQKKLEDQLAEGKEEHTLGEKLLIELESMSVTTVAWKAKMSVLKENTEHHLDEEEEEMFVDAKKVIPEREEQEALAQAFQERKRQLLEEMA